jgi:hypothetical protein
VLSKSARSNVIRLSTGDGPLDELSGLVAAGISDRLEERGGEAGVAAAFPALANQ